MGFGTIIKLEMEGEIGIVTYDTPGVPVNTWSPEALAEY